MISTQVVRLLTDATIVVDVNAATGYRLDAVAAYAAFVAFAEIRAGDFNPPDSILGLFESPPGTLSELAGQDRAFLRAVYQLPLDRQARRHRGLLVRDLVAAATGEGGVHRASAADWEDVAD